ncbi:hypothetical protein FF32_15670 [Halomonas campaniensis]|nr:hypothetical protein FF32_15670 [Halomonas campaniensis]
MHVKSNAIEQARITLKGAWDGRLPVCPERISVQTKMILHRDGQESEHNILMKGWSDEDLNGDSGFAEFREEDVGQPFWCVYNIHERPDRQRFTMAHEFGHVVLGHVIEGKKPKRDSNFNARGDLDEIAANTFAAELLMPEDLVRDLSKRITALDALAMKFRVSPSAMKNRLKALGII